jgi:hypothetical protein
LALAKAFGYGAVETQPDDSLEKAIELVEAKPPSDAVN